MAAGGTSSGKTNLTLPVNLNGSYFIIACADYSNLAVESNETNNCNVSGAISVH
ncbi:MAG TPA: CARDB domain-containing protein [Terriglobales bacterium]|nr:CARDB domain-containing protein [Terriglobales bacterium]